jgi:hypothetical protein
MADEPFSIYDVPQIGKWYGRTGHVIRILSTPCSPSVEVWVTAFWHATPHLLWSLFKPDTNDLVTARWGTKHGKRRGKKFRPLDWLTPVEKVPKGLATAVFDLGNLAERVGWYMMVVDATTEFAVHWTSTAYQWTGCGAPGVPYAHSAALDENHGPYAAGSYPFAGWVVQTQQGFFADADSIGTPPGYEVSVGVSMNFIEVHGGVEQCSIGGVRLVDEQSNQVLWEGDPTSLRGNRSQISRVWNLWGGFEPTHDFRVWIDKTDGFYNCANSQFTCYGSKDIGMTFDP